ncbi:MAG TPA: UbiA family prenyltransferase, partial [Methylomirabilota bacterium]|nr:UbiA family prenyltransferase [Methylomirabilota bacterium]
MAAVAVVAGAAPAVATQLGISMTALQASIGALNDLHDAPDDAGRKPGKPIPAGLVTVPVARAVVAVGAVVGICLAGLVDGRLAALAVVVLVIGFGYDLVAKGTAWSWLPYAAGIPILLIYGWLGGAGVLPGLFAALMPMATLAGAALSIANARADLERDHAAGTVSVATALGRERAWRLHAVLWVATAAVALGSLAVGGAEPLRVVLVVAAICFMGAVILWSRDLRPDGRERAWEFEAVGAAIALLAWLFAAIP